MFRDDDDGAAAWAAFFMRLSLRRIVRICAGVVRDGYAFDKRADTGLKPLCRI